MGCTLETPSCAHINPFHPFAAPSNHLCEHRTKSLLLVKFSSCEASMIYIASKILINYQIILIPMKHVSTQFGIISMSHLITKIIPSFWTELMFVKQVPFWLVNLHELFTTSLYVHIMRICQVASHSITPCECIIQILILDQFWGYIATILVCAPLWLPIFLGLLLSI